MCVLVRLKSWTPKSLSSAVLNKRIDDDWGKTMMQTVRNAQKPHVTLRFLLSTVAFRNLVSSVAGREGGSAETMHHWQIGPQSTRFSAALYQDKQSWKPAPPKKEFWEKLPNLKTVSCEEVLYNEVSEIQTAHWAVVLKGSFYEDGHYFSPFSVCRNSSNSAVPLSQSQSYSERNTLHTDRELKH